MNLRVIDDREELLELTPIWNSLELDSIQHTFFQRCQINLSSIEYLQKDDKINILIIENNGLVEAIFPCYLDKKNRLRFINDIHFDFCGPLIRKSTDLNLIFKNFAKYIDREPKISGVEFVNIFSESIASQLNFHFKKYKQLSSNIQHTILNNYKAWNQLKSSQKSELKRISNKYPGFLSIISKSFPENEIHALKNQMIDSGIRDQQFFNTSFVAWIKSLYDLNILEIKQFIKDSEVLAVSLHLVDNDYRLVWIDLFLPKQAVNIAHYIKFIENTNENIISLGRGSYSYKTHNFPVTPVNLYNFTSHKNFILFGLFHIKNVLKSMLKSMLKSKQY